MPTFTLHAAGAFPGGFFRQYELKAPGLTCEINETFANDCFDHARDPPRPVERPCDGRGYRGI